MCGLNRHDHLHTPPTGAPADRRAPTRGGPNTRLTLLWWAGLSIACLSAPTAARPPAPQATQSATRPTTPAPASASASRQPLNRTLIDRSLHSTPVKLVGISQGHVTYFGIDDPPGTAARTVDASSLLAIVASPEDSKARPRRSPLLVTEPNSPPPVRVTLTDGQRLIGRVAEGGGPPSKPSARAGDSGAAAEQAEDTTLRLEVPDLGPDPITLKLDQIVRIETLTDPFSSKAQSADVSTQHSGTAKEDEIVLLNGDVVRGFVESVGAQVAVQLKPGEAATKYPLTRVDRVLIANPLGAPSGPCAWLSDGSMIALAEGAASGPDFLAAPGRLGGSLRVKPHEVVGIALEAGLMTPLSACAVAEYRAAPERSWTSPPKVSTGDSPLNASNIEIPGPMTVEWELPIGATRLSGTVELTRSTERWGDCVVVIEDVLPGVAPKRVFNQRLTADAPRAAYDVAISATGQAGHRLRVVLEVGENGPILDRVVLTRPLLLISPALRDRLR